MAQKKVLIVDDSTTVLLMEQQLLRQLACDVITARDGVEAVEKALAERPDAILMDVMMPRMGGFDACKAIRQRAETRDIPIILVTTRSEPVNVEIGYAAGCNDYLTKPIDTLALIEKLKQYLGE